jgi:hypothetical protein
MSSRNTAYLPICIVCRYRNSAALLLWSLDNRFFFLNFLLEKYLRMSILTYVTVGSSEARITAAFISIDLVDAQSRQTWRRFALVNFCIQIENKIKANARKLLIAAKSVEPMVEIEIRCP